MAKRGGSRTACAAAADPQWYSRCNAFHRCELRQDSHLTPERM